jgi:hypothetical protein
LQGKKNVNLAKEINKINNAKLLERKKNKQRRERKIWQSFRKTERAKTLLTAKRGDGYL